MTPVEIMIGSNAPLRRDIVERAVGLVGLSLDVSFRSEPVDNPDFTGEGPDYLNVVIRGTTVLDLDRLTAEFSSIERMLGRGDYERPVVGIDIDVVTYGSAVIKPAEYNSDIFRRISGTLGPICRQ